MPQSSASSASTRTIEFRYQAKSRTSIGVTYRYLLQNRKWSSQEGKVKFNSAVAAFWQALAHLENAKDESDVAAAREMAVEAIHQMESHVVFLRQKFGVPGSGLSGMVAGMNPTQPINVIQTADTNRLALYPPGPVNQPASLSPATAPVAPVEIPAPVPAPVPEPAAEAVPVPLTRIPGAPMDNLDMLLFDDE